MVGHYARALLTMLLALALLTFWPAGNAACPKPINDCGAGEVPLPSTTGLPAPGDGGPALGGAPGGPETRVFGSASAGGYTLDLVLDMDGEVKDRQAHAGARGNLTATLGNETGAGPVHIAIDLSNHQAAWIDANETYGFDYDPASGVQAEGVFPVQADAERGSYFIFTVLFTVTQADGTVEQDMAILSMGVAESHPPRSGWLLPAAIGLAAGAVLTALLWRRRPR